MQVNKRCSKCDRLQAECSKLSDALGVAETFIKEKGVLALNDHIYKLEGEKKKIQEINDKLKTENTERAARFKEMEMSFKGEKDSLRQKLLQDEGTIKELEETKAKNSSEISSLQQEIQDLRKRLDEAEERSDHGTTKHKNCEKCQDSIVKIEDLQSLIRVLADTLKLYEDIAKIVEVCPSNKILWQKGYGQVIEKITGPSYLSHKMTDFMACVIEKTKCVLMEDVSEQKRNARKRGFYCALKQTDSDRLSLDDSTTPLPVTQVVGWQGSPESCKTELPASSSDRRQSADALREPSEKDPDAQNSRTTPPRVYSLHGWEQKPGARAIAKAIRKTVNAKSSSLKKEN